MRGRLMARGHKGWRQQVVYSLMRKFGNQCHNCERTLLTYGEFIELRNQYPHGHVKDRPDDYPTIDHWVPVSKGGTHRFVNLRLMCADCNGSKDDTMPTVFHQEMFAKPEDIKTTKGLKRCFRDDPNEEILRLYAGEL